MLHKIQIDKYCVFSFSNKWSFSIVLYLGGNLTIGKGSNDLSSDT